MLACKVAGTVDIYIPEVFDILEGMSGLYMTFIVDASELGRPLRTRSRFVDRILSSLTISSILSALNLALQRLATVLSKAGQ